MTLTSANLLPYLVHRGALTTAELSRGEATVFPSGGRNRNFRVRFGDGGLFVKQFRHDAPHAATLMLRESAVYAVAHTTPDLASLREIMPRFVDADRNRLTLVLSLLDDAVNLNEFHAHENDFPSWIGELAADVLAAYHGISGGMLIALVPESMRANQRPWAFAIGRSAATMFNGLTAGSSAIVAAINGDPDFSAALDRLDREWRRTTLINGDVKWDNFLLTGSDDHRRLTIADWELADVGDPAWDVGSFLEGYLRYWIGTIPVAALLDGAQEIDGRAVSGGGPRAFWERYTQLTSSSGSDAGTFLDECVRCTAARLVQTAFELSHDSAVFGSQAALMLQVSRNIFCDPLKAASVLFGIETP
jgi:hypothetical protein